MDAAGETALATADRRGHTELVALLRQRIAISLEPGTGGAVAPELDHGNLRVRDAPLHSDFEEVPAFAIDVLPVADVALPPPADHSLHILPGIRSMPAMAEVRQPSNMLPAQMTLLNSADTSDAARLASLIVDDPKVEIPDTNEEFDLSGWEPDEDQPLPEHDAECAAEANILRHRIATHTPVDTDADWTNIDISLPDSEPLRRRRTVIDDDRLDAVRRLLIQGLRDGFVTHGQITTVAVDASGVPDNEFALQLNLALGESGIMIAEDTPELQPASEPEEAGEDEEDAIMDAFAFMQNLASRHNDPASLYSLDLSRSGDLLTREEEVDIGQTFAAVFPVIPV